MHPRQALNTLLSSSDFHALEARLRRVSAFHVLGIDTRELSHASLLAWFLDPRASHGMGAEPLRKFLLLGAHRANDDQVLDAVDLDRLDLSDALVQTERSISIPGSDRRRRLDIIVELDLPEREEPAVIAVVEYKVDAAEGDDQTADYAAWCATQHSDIGGRRTLPVQIYLCPDPSDERLPAQPFVNLGYDEYLMWVGDIAGLEKTAQAEFLLNEWRECMLSRNDVDDEEEDRLTSVLRKEYADAVTAIREAASRDLSEYRAVLDQHSEVFSALGIRTTRRAPHARGYSGLIAALRAELEEHLTADLWAIAGGGGSVRAAFVPFINAVAENFGGTPRVSGARLQIYADRPNNGRIGVAVEMIGNLPGKSAEESRAFRLHTAARLQEALRAVDPSLPVRSSATCLRFTLEVPEITDLEKDTDQVAARYQPELTKVARTLAELEHVFAAQAAAL